MKTQLQALVAMATELQDAGAVRPEHNTKWQALRVALDQAVDQAEEPAPAEPIGEQLARIEDCVTRLVDAAGV